MKLVLLLLMLAVISACGKVTVVPADRVIVSLDNGTEPLPGWYGISGGFLREIYRQCGGAE